jgi:hypothetical protein
MTIQPAKYATGIDDQQQCPSLSAPQRDWALVSRAGKVLDRRLHAVVGELVAALVEPECDGMTTAGYWVSFTPSSPGAVGTANSSASTAHNGTTNNNSPLAGPSKSIGTLSQCISPT